MPVQWHTQPQLSSLLMCVLIPKQTPSAAVGHHTTSEAASLQYMHPGLVLCFSVEAPEVCRVMIRLLHEERILIWACKTCRLPNHCLLIYAPVIDTGTPLHTVLKSSKSCNRHHVFKYNLYVLHELFRHEMGCGEGLIQCRPLTLPGRGPG